MEQEPKEKQAVCSSAPVSGYATDERTCEIITPDGRRLDNVAAMCNEMKQLLRGVNSYGWPQDRVFLSTAHACRYFHDREMKWESQVAGLKARVAKLTAELEKSHNEVAERRAQQKGNNDE